MSENFSVLYTEDGSCIVPETSVFNQIFMTSETVLVVMSPPSHTELLAN